MTAKRKPTICTVFLLVFVLVAAQSCTSATPTPDAAAQLSSGEQNPGNQAIQAPETVTPSAVTATPQVATIQLFVPNFSEAARSQLQTQIQAFERQYQAKVQVTFLDTVELPDPTRPPPVFIGPVGRPPTVVALNNAEVIFLAQGQYLRPLQDPAELSPFLDDAVKNNKLGETAFGYPWQRYSCSPNFLHLGVVQTGSDNSDAAARVLAAFLANQENQNSNLSNPNLRFFPTLRSFYDGQSVACPTVERYSLNPSLNGQMVRDARTQAQLFSGQRNFQFQPGQVAGIDGSAFVSDAAVLKAFALPTTSLAQTYKDRLLVGSLTVIDPAVTPRSLSSQGKASMQSTKLPTGTYAFACRAPDDCLAITLTGQEYQVDPSTVKITQLPAPVQAPTVAFIKGSVTACFYIGSVQYCITLF